MASLTVPLNVNVDAKNKEAATKIFKDLGLNMSTAINMFLAQVVKKDGIPFEISNTEKRKLSKEEKADLKEIKYFLKHPEKYPSYHNWEELEKALLSDDE